MINEINLFYSKDNQLKMTSPQEELKQLEKEIGETQELIKEGQRQSKEVDEDIVKKKDELANLDKEIKYMKSSLFWSKFI